MTFDYVDCYPALLDELIIHEALNHPRLSSRKIIVHIFGVLYNNYDRLMSGWFPDLNDPTIQRIIFYLERNFGRSISHKDKHIIITDVPVKINISKRSHDNRCDSLNLKVLTKGNFDYARLSKKDRNELRRWLD